MDSVWLYTLSSVLLVSVLSFVGVIVLVIKQKTVKKILLFMVSFAAGALLGDVFLHMLPELIHEGKFTLVTSFYILGGIVLFFILEKIICWRHCHMTASKDHVHTLAFMNLVGDGVHNFIDGALIAGSFLLSIPVGIATTIAVILHEIPQEMGDFGVLLHSGMKPKKALLFNFLSAVTAILGAVIILVIGLANIEIVEIIIPITIGGFLYIANADLIPELHKDTKISNSIVQLLSFILGIGIMFLIIFLPFHGHMPNKEGTHNHENEQHQEHEDHDDHETGIESFIE